MNMRYFFILIVITVFFSFSCVSAIDSDNLNNITEINIENSEGDYYSVVNDNDVLENSLDESYILKDESNDIYVGTNGNPSGADGSRDNPYATLQDACSNIKNKESVTLKIFEGTYEIGEVSDLTFDTKNLIIEPVNGNVVFKSMYNVDPDYDYEDYQLAISLKNTKSSCIFSNITFDLSECQVEFWEGFFTTFIGDQINLTYNDCIFNGFHRGIDGYTGASILPMARAQRVDVSNSNIVFNKCFFSDSTDSFGAVLKKSNITFNYCMFNTTFPTYFKNMEPNSIIFNCNWFGQNTVPNFVTSCVNAPSNIVNYVMFGIVENYLGNNNYEIIGKLVYNGTDDVIVDLPIMSVSLTSTGGTLESNTATLENGTFKVRYTSENPQNTVTATLDSAVLQLNFNTVNMEATANPIAYGADQNITVTLPEAMDGTITIKVNNKTYTQQIFGEKVITYQITEEILKEGNYSVNVLFTSEDGHSYGSADCYLNVSKISEYEFDATITPNNVYMGDNATVTLSLPDGANGTVTVKVGDNEAKTFNVNETITIDGFVAGDNVVNITYNGNDAYDAKSVVKTVVASTKPTALAASDVTTTYNVTKELVITLTSNGDVLANKMINVVVGSINENLTTNASGQVSIDISSLTPDTYTANIAFAGDDLYNKSSTIAKVTVKEEIKTNITVPEIVAGKETTTTITLPQNATGNVTVTVDGKEYSVVPLTNGSATVTIPDLPAGKHNVTISYSGDDNYAGFAQTSAVEVKEPAKPTTQPDDQKPATTKKTATKITAKKKTFKAKTKVKKYTITLKAGKKAVKKVQVILKIGKKTFKAKTNAKGKATFKIKKLTKKGKYNAKITFKGNKLYKASSKKVKITVKK